MFKFCVVPERNVQVQYPRTQERFLFDMWVMDIAVKMVMWSNPKFELEFLAPEVRAYISQELGMWQRPVYGN